MDPVHKAETFFESCASLWGIRKILFFFLARETGASA